MNSKSLLWLLATVLLATVSPAEPQQPKKVPRIGYLGGNKGVRSHLNLPMLR